MLEITSYLSAFFVGISLGLIGSGGSILSVPILIYLFGLDDKIATAYSLFIVGTVAVSGSIAQLRMKNIDWRIVTLFGLPSIIGVLTVRKWIVPSLPLELFEIGSFVLTRRLLMFSIFLILMLLAAYSMLKDKSNIIYTKENKSNTLIVTIMLEGLVVGGLTGFVGAGGGFLIVPVLMYFAGLEIKKAIGTSLVIVAVKSLVGFFLGDVFNITVDWMFLGLFTTIAFVGMLIGIQINKYINGSKLTKGFAYFVLLMAFFIFCIEFIF